MSKLTAKQEQFCQEYLIDLNGTQAAIRAGYSEKTAQAISAENLAKPLIAARISELMRERQSRVQISQDDVLSMIRDCYQGAYGDGNWSAALKATEQFGKHLGMFTDKLNVAGQIGLVWVEPDADD